MDQDKYVKCPCCGEYFPSEEAVFENYCSWTCMGKYSQCRNCGKYFLKEKGISEDLCSPECGEQFELITKY